MRPQERDWRTSTLYALLILNLAIMCEIIIITFQIYIPYCSSDAHMADYEREVDDRLIQFRGKRLAFETVKSLLGDKENQLVLFGGTSAGGKIHFHFYFSHSNNLMSLQISVTISGHNGYSEWRTYNYLDISYLLNAGADPILK